MKFIAYIILIFIIGIIAAVLNLVEGIYFGLAVPTLNNLKIGNVSVKMPRTLYRSPVTSLTS